MQNKGTAKGKRAKATLVRKPYLMGRAVSSLSARRGLRVFGYLIVSAVLFFFLGQMLALETTWLRMALNLIVIMAFSALMFTEGAHVGEGDVSFAEIALNRKTDGRILAPGDLSRCFHPAKGFFTAFIGTLPVMLLCLVYAFMAREDHYTLGTLPSWLGAYESRADIALALSYYQDRAGLQAADILRLAVRLLVFPYVNLVGAGSSMGILWVERLSPLLVFIAPAFYGLGYMQGERYRAMVHGGILTNQRKAARRKKKERPQRREPRQLV